MTLAESNGNNQDMSATILLVEDDEPLLEFFSTVLRREGYNVLTAENGPEALEIAKNRPGQRIATVSEALTLRIVLMSFCVGLGA